MFKMAFSQILIPKLRIKVIIGKYGEVRKKIESLLKVKLFVHSDSGEIDINSDDCVDLMIAENIIRAIGRGFNPSTALKLVDDNYTMELVELSEFKAKTKGRKLALKGRVIGKNGATKRIIETYSDCSISIFGKTIAIIGKHEAVIPVRRAVELLLQGASHGTVYRFLEDTFSENSSKN